MAGKERGRVVQPAAKQSSHKTIGAKRESLEPRAGAADIVQRMMNGTGMPSAGEMLQLQSSIGNRAVGQLLSRRLADSSRRLADSSRRGALQAKLIVGAADDPYEREADHVAAQVLSRSVSTPAGVSRTKSTFGMEDDADPTARRKLAITPLMQRNSDDLGLAGSFDAGQDVERQITANRSGGNPLPAKLRSELEPKFGADFSNVRVHTGAQSDSLNHSIGAQAFTHSNHIYMAAGKYNPGTGSGKRLLAHELTHVVQQGGSVNRRVQRYPATALKSNSRLNWMRDTVQVIRPGEGVSGGVYIFKSNAPLETIVVKPEFTPDTMGSSNDPQEDAKANKKNRLNAKAQTSFATNVLKAAGINTPDTRIVGDREKAQIIAAADHHGHTIPTSMTDGMETNELAFIRIMGKAEGSSMGSEVRKVTDNWDLVTLINRFSNVSLMKEVGKMMAIDCFMRMGDRIDPRKSNLGNIMFAGNVATAIDNTSNFKRLTQFTKAQITVTMASIMRLFTNRVELIDAFIDAVKFEITDQAVQQQFVNYMALNGLVVQNWRNAIDQGMVEGIAALRSLFANKQTKKGLTKNAAGWGKKGSNLVTHEGFREQEKLFSILDSGEQDPKEIAEQLQQYHLYREARAKRWAGFKWMTKKNKQRT